MSTVLITGGTGLIGTALSKMLRAKGFEVIILTRDAPGDQNRSFATWNIQKGTIDPAAIQSADHIIHLAGANISEKRWTTKRKKEIAESRTKSSALLVKALREIPNKVKTVVSASAIGWYGEDPVIPNPKPFVETDPADEGFLGTTCKAWEENIQPVTDLGIRLVKLRTGIVLSNEGGALKEFKNPLKFGTATILGNGKQVISWIHIEDLCRLYCFAIENEKFRNVYNACATRQVSNKEMTLKLAKKLRGKFFIPVHVPGWALNLFLGEMSIEILKSTTVGNQKVRHSGFQFLYPNLPDALNDLLKKH